MDKYKQYERVFNHFDEDGDMKISPFELQKYVGLIGGVMSLEEAEAAVTSIDLDGDGLCLDDFVKLVEGAGEEEKENDLKEAFAMYEMEGSGCILPKSLKRMLSRLGESKTIEECKLMIAHYDINGDGQLNFDEFKPLKANIGYMLGTHYPYAMVMSHLGCKAMWDFSCG
ncbi:calcium-binding CML38 [Olea europaea subsp. europaea]|uniref:Calcium-binding CML38 n=1 Tax=Olea europaea subsp. europaea TaxID=158383 RepID=A0A8S0RJS6_OLEEU|nr:calcium-binding CML38 [Olea europaea subsp. europaea]